MKNNKEQGFTVPHILLFLLVLGFIGGTGYYVYSQQDSKNNTVNSQDSKQEPKKELALPTDLTGLKTADEIRTIAGTSLGSATIVSVELENEDGGLVFKVKLSDGKILFFDAKSGAPMTAAQVKDDGPENDAEDDDSSSIPAGFVAGITVDQAKTTAQSKLPGKTVQKVEIEPEEGVMVYSVRFTDGSRVDVNATTGAVTRTENKSAPAGSTSTTPSSNDDSKDDSVDDSSDDSDDSNDDSGGNSGSGSSGSGGSGSGRN